jgi:hypothetical protein
MTRKFHDLITPFFMACCTIVFLSLFLSYTMRSISVAYVRLCCIHCCDGRSAAV